jgi:tetratricopeptide (TPR) repeat protein
MILLIYQATIKISLVVKRTFIAILFCIPLTINVIAQNQPKPIEYRFLYGETGLRDYLSRNSTFPANSILNNTIGFSLSSITINPYGAIEDIKILNPIDQFIDKEVTRVLKSSASLWQKCDTIETWKSDFMILSPVRNIFFMEPVVVSVSRWTSEEALMFQTNELLGVKSNILVNCGRYQESLTFLDELIRRNPFSKELYQFRIMVYRKIGNNDLINKDLRRLTDFAEGLTLDEILKRK